MRMKVRIDMKGMIVVRYNIIPDFGIAIIRTK